MKSKRPELPRGQSERMLLTLGLATSLLLAPVAQAQHDSKAKPKPARVRISGFGLMGNRTLRAALHEIKPEKDMTVFEASFIEDAFLILRNRLAQDGYLDPLIRANLTLTNGLTQSLWWDGHEDLSVPREVQAVRLHLEVERGVLYHYDSIQIDGVTSIPQAKARGFFIIEDALLRLKSSRRFSPGQLKTSLNNLRRELENQGHRDAVVVAEQVTLDPETGNVQVVITVDEGLRYVVRSVNIDVTDSDNPDAVEPWPVSTNATFSILWEQDAAQTINRQFYVEGHPDVHTQIRIAGSEHRDDVIEVDLLAEVTPGNQVALGDVRFKGDHHTRLSFLERRVTVDGPLLDRLEAERGRERLARLGSFKFVDLSLEPEDGETRDVVYELTEGRRYDLDLIAGYGSYDQWFGGLQFEHFNLWGVGHHARFRGVQAIKSTQLSFTYTIPELVKQDMNLFVSADGFRREELTFDRREIVLSLGTRRQFPRSGHQVGLRYSYEFLDSFNTPVLGVAGDNTRAAAIIADWQLDRRDNPLLPRRGYRAYANVEFANRALGGDSDYTWFEIGGSYHHPIRPSLILHLALLHQVVFTPDRTTLLPFNKRFFPGGENSVRGYQRGGASPLNDQGDQIGAESVVQGNVELEQRLTRAFSLVGFLDGVGTTPNINDYPASELLWSVGGGIRWNTIIGPVRLEYGYNLTPRSADPSGTLHISMGFPF